MTLIPSIYEKEKKSLGCMYACAGGMGYEAHGKETLSLLPAVHSLSTPLERRLLVLI